MNSPLLSNIYQFVHDTLTKNANFKRSCVSRPRGFLFWKWWHHSISWCYELPNGMRKQIASLIFLFENSPGWKRLKWGRNHIWSGWFVSMLPDPLCPFKVFLSFFWGELFDGYLFVSHFTNQKFLGTVFIIAYPPSPHRIFSIKKTGKLLFWGYLSITDSIHELHSNLTLERYSCQDLAQQFQLEVRNLGCSNNYIWIFSD